MKTLLPCIGAFLCFVGVLVAQDTQDSVLSRATEHFDLGSDKSSETVQIPLIIETVISRTADLGGFEIGTPEAPASVPVRTFAPPTQTYAPPCVTYTPQTTTTNDCGGAAVEDDNDRKGILSRLRIFKRLRDRRI